MRWMRGAKSVQTIGYLLKPVGANSVRPLQNQTNFCRKRGCTECPPTSLCRSAPTLASLCRGRGTTKWWWESFKDKVTFPRIRTRTARPYEFVRRARSFGRVAPSRMTPYGVARYNTICADLVGFTQTKCLLREAL